MTLKLINSLSYYSKDSSVWILYRSPVHWKYTIMAEVDLSTNTISIYKGDNTDDRHVISDFIYSNNKPRELEQTGCDLGLIQSALETLDELSEDDNVFYIVQDLKKHILSENMLFDAQVNNELERSLTKDEVISIIEVYRGMYLEFASKEKCYAGITGDLDIRMYQHNHDDEYKPGSIGIGILCCNRSMAIAVEQELHSIGYQSETDKPGNGARDTSCIVYIYRVTE